MAPTTVGLLGGSGLYDPSVFGKGGRIRTKAVHGRPSDSVWVGRVGDTRVAFLARHGRDRRIPAHRVPHRANVWALREAGAEAVLATSSVGSLKRSAPPGTFVVPDDFVSFWTIPTYFDDEVRHATPAFDAGLREALVRGARRAKAKVRDGGVYVQTRGPRLETRAEIAFFRRIGDVVGMTVASEATLAAELDVPYAALCSVDNYCNGIVAEPLTYEAIVRAQRRNAARLRRAIVETVRGLP